MQSETHLAFPAAAGPGINRPLEMVQTDQRIRFCGKNNNNKARLAFSQVMATNCFPIDITNLKRKQKKR
jgi:hypothetical protein